MNATKPIPDAIVLDALRRAPAVEKAVADRAAAIVAERKALVARLAEIEDGAPARRYLDAVKRTEKLAEEADKAHRAFEAAKLAFDQAYAERVIASQTIATERTEVIAQLHAGADNTAIDAFVHWARIELTTTRKAIDAREQVTENKITGARNFTVESNSALVAARVLSLNEAITEAEDLRLLPDQSSVPAKLQELRNRIPRAVSPLASHGRDV